MSTKPNTITRDTFRKLSDGSEIRTSLLRFAAKKMREGDRRAARHVVKRALQHYMTEHGAA